jgi:uncharacterized integral membrane protein
MSSTAPGDGSQKSGVSKQTIAAVLLLVVVIVFAAINLQTVRVHWLFTTTRTPLVVVIVVAGLLGAGIGAVVRRRRLRERKQRNISEGD